MRWGHTRPFRVPRADQLGPSYAVGGVTPAETEGVRSCPHVGWACSAGFPAYDQVTG
jgi:hypothetical protein